MGDEEKSTLEKILTCAKAEFSQKGFQAASLRNIVKTAGVTTGAFYGYFDSKEALFDALVGEQYDTVMEMYRETQEAFAKLPPKEQMAGMGELSGACMERMLEYAYANKDAFRLILCSSEGTRYAGLVHEMVEIEVEATHAFAAVLESLGHARHQLDPALEHILVSGMFSAFFEMIIHEMPYEKASVYLNGLRAFYTAGWKQIMGF